MAHACNYSAQAVETADLKFKVTLVYITRPCLKQNILEQMLDSDIAFLKKRKKESM